MWILIFYRTLKPEYFEKNLKNFVIPFESLVMDDKLMTDQKIVSNGFEAITLFKEEENEPQRAFPCFLI